MVVHVSFESFVHKYTDVSLRFERRHGQSHPTTNTVIIVCCRCPLDVRFSLFSILFTHRNGEMKCVWEVRLVIDGKQDIHHSKRSKKRSVSWESFNFFLTRFFSLWEFSVVEESWDEVYFLQRKKRTWLVFWMAQVWNLI